MQALAIPPMDPAAFVEEEVLAQWVVQRILKMTVLGIVGYLGWLDMRLKMARQTDPMDLIYTNCSLHMMLGCKTGCSVAVLLRKMHLLLMIS